MEKPSALIPEHKEGIQTNTESIAEFDNEGDTSKFFEVARKRLLAVNRWHDLAGTASAEFQLTGPSGEAVNRAPAKGDYFKIKIPAPGTDTGEGFDWVRVEAIEETDSCVIIQVRPASNPLNDREDVAHFFSAEATSSFMVRKEGNRVIAGIYGRNEKPNTDTEKLTDTLRNAAVATGAITGFSKLQWKNLVNGLVKSN